MIAVYRGTIVLVIYKQAFSNNVSIKLALPLVPTSGVTFVNVYSLPTLHVYISVITNMHIKL